MRLCPIFEWSLRAPEKIAVFTSVETLSYKQLNAKIDSYCGPLKTFPAGSRLPFIAATSLETVCFLFAAWRLKLIASPLSFRLPEKAIADILQRLQAPLIRPAPGPPERAVELDEEQLATMMLTSGTTGQPKIACHRLAHFLSSAETAIPLLHLESNDCYLASLPFFHVGGIGLMLRAFLSGAALLFSPHLFDLRLTHLSLVPTQLYRLLQEKPAHFHPKCLLVGGAPLPPKLYEEASGLNLYTTYGMTETSSMITLNGNVAGHLEVKIESDQEIWVRGRSLFEGYLNADQTLSSPLVDGWLPTKDRGQLTAEGKLEILGRKDRLFISGGENIQPEEIETAILSLFNLQQATVLPYEDEEFGMRPAAYIYDPEQTVTLEILQKKLKGILPGFKIPQKLFYLTHLKSKI